MAVDRGPRGVPPLRCEGEVFIDGPAGPLCLVGVEDGLELRLRSLRQAWSMRGLPIALPWVEPLTGVLAWWRLSGVPIHLVVAGRRVALAEPAHRLERRSWWMPAPWQPKTGVLIRALLAAAIGRG